MHSCTLGLELMFYKKSTTFWFTTFTCTLTDWLNTPHIFVEFFIKFIFPFYPFSHLYHHNLYTYILLHILAVALRINFCLKFLIRTAFIKWYTTLLLYMDKEALRRLSWSRSVRLASQYEHKLYFLSKIVRTRRECCWGGTYKTCT